MKFGHVLKRYQLAAGVSAPELARRLNVASQQIYRWHKCSDAKLSVIRNICIALDADEMEFIYEVLED